MSRIDPSTSRKRHKSYSANHRDRISKLPDDVLSHVLSRMPIKDAVRTCVLSKHWEFKWTSISKLNISIEDFPRKSTRALTHVSIVERLLFHLHMLKNLSLSCSCPTNSDVSGIIMLISAILRRNIRRLRLELTENHYFVLPRSLLNCTSLRKLYLQFETPCSFKVPANNHFPNLKSLSLGGVKILNEISDSDTLVFNFPALEVLELKMCKWVKVKFVEIHAPSLHTFTSETPYQRDDNFGYSIKIYGAKIAQLNTDGGYPENIILIGSTVDVANLECFAFYTPLSPEEYGLRVRKLLREVSNVKQLCVIDVLPAIRRTKRGLPIPRFCNLKVMQIGYPIDGDAVLELLNASPYLEELELLLDKNEDNYSLENVPSCVVHHLEKLTIYYHGMLYPDYDYLVEKFLLKNGAQLKIVCIQTHKEFPEKELLDKFEMFPKASTCLKIVSTPASAGVRMGCLTARLMMENPLFQ